MTFLWDQPYYFFLLCLCVSFWVRSRRVLSEVGHRSTLGAFLWEQCDPGQRRAVLRGLLTGLPGDHCALQALILLAMLRAGGAGCLFWYALFSLLWLRPAGALAALWRYYRGSRAGGVELAGLLEEGLRRRGAGPRPRLVRGLRALQIVGVWTALPLLLSPLVGSDTVVLLEGERLLWLLPAAVGWLFCLAGGTRARALCGAGFLLFLGAALAANLANLFPVLGMALLDTFQASRLIFALSGAGLSAALRGGVQLGAGLAMGRGAVAEPGRPSFSHPVQDGFYAQLRALVQLILQLVMAVLFLCAQLVPGDNGWVQGVLYIFLSLFSLLALTDLAAALARGSARKGWWGLLFPAAALLRDAAAGTEWFTLLFWGVCWLASLAAAALLVADGSWYFALLEHYRDRYIWHVKPHPDLPL